MIGDIILFLKEWWKQNIAFNDFIYHIEYFTGNKYLVTGDLLNKTGTNGEPLIKNVKIIKKL